MRLRFAAVLVGLSQFAFPSLGFADMPGLLEAPPGFNNLPFSLPTGEAIWCYMLRDELKPVSKEEASFFFEGQKEYLAELLTNTNTRMFRLPHSDLAVVARHGCGKTCKVDIVVRSMFNIEFYKDISLGKSPRVEVVPNNDDWKTRFGFDVWINDLKRNGKKVGFGYQRSSGTDRSKAQDRVEYGFGPDTGTACLDL